jgi:GTP-binding protein YchF
MKLAIIGLPNCGKTTVFNALTRGTAETATFSSGRMEPNLASVRVPDPRLEVLAGIYKPKKTTAAEVQYVDVAGLRAAEDRKEELSPELLGLMGTADALVHVVRTFEDDHVPHPQDTIDPQRDLSLMELELIFSDLAIIERRLERLQKDVRRLSGQERSLAEADLDLLTRLRGVLEQEQPISNVTLSAQEEKRLRGYSFLSMKPVLVVLNIGEDQNHDTIQIKSSHSRSSVVPLSAKVEAELAQLDDAEAREFMEVLNIEKPARDRVISSSYALLGLISFLTVGEDEVRAWTIREGTPAAEAGGVIHSDIQRGFIRAEVIPFEDLARAGGMVAAKKQGLVRLEGKDYPLQDGEIAHFLFNV